jgi:excisionase family DNA binding protein
MRNQLETHDISAQFLTVGEFAVRTRLSPPTVRRMRVRGEVAHVVVSERGDRRIPASEVDRLLDDAEQARSGEQQR